MKFLASYNCHQAYAKGIADRLDHPFTASSLYKIREFKSRLILMPANLVNIGKCAGGDKNACGNLRGCVPHDKALWTKRLPRFIAYDLAFKLVSAVPSLKHEGLTAQNLEGINDHLNDKIQGLIELAEQAANELKRNWKCNASQLARGAGTAHELPLAAEALVYWVLVEVERCRRP